MFNLRKSIIGTAVAAAFAFPAASFATPSIMFDNTGGGGGVSTNQFSWDNGNVLMDNIAPASSTPAADMYGQTTMGAAQGGVGRRFTYQFDIPVTSLAFAGNPNGQFSQIAMSNDTTRTGYFRIYVDTDLVNGAPDPNSGYGYGAANPGDPTGLKLILSGVARLDSSFSMLQTQPSTTLSSLGTETGGIGKTVSSTQMQGTAALDIDVASGACDGTLTDTTCVDTGYFIGNISSFTLTLGIATTADATIPTFGLNAPFGPGNPASSTVVGVTGAFGDGQSHTQILLPSNTGAVPVTVTQPINDFLCNVHTVIIPGVLESDSAGTGPCDVQAASAGNMFVNHENAPEPASIALLGLGLAGLGFSIRRRRKSAA